MSRLIKWGLRRPKTEPDTDFFLDLKVLGSSKFVLVGRFDIKADRLRLEVYDIDPQVPAVNVIREVAVIERPSQDGNRARIIRGRDAAEVA